MGLSYFYFLALITNKSAALTYATQLAISRKFGLPCCSIQDKDRRYNNIKWLPTDIRFEFQNMRLF